MKKPPTLSKSAIGAATRFAATTDEEERRWLQSVIVDRGSDSKGFTNSFTLSLGADRRPAGTRRVRPTGLILVGLAACRQSGAAERECGRLSSRLFGFRALVAASTILDPRSAEMNRRMLIATIAVVGLLTPLAYAEKQPHATGLGERQGAARDSGTRQRRPSNQSDRAHQPRNRGSASRNGVRQHPSRSTQKIVTYRP
jgi:hypothetical protein